MLKKFFLKNSYGLIGLDQLLVTATGFILSIVLARRFGLEGLGLFALAQTGLMFCALIHAAFVNMPISTTFTQFSSRSDSLDRDTYFATSHHLTMLLIAFMTIFCSLIIIYFFKFKDLTSILLGIIVCIIPMLTFYYLRAISLAEFDYISALKMDATYSFILIFSIVFLELPSVISVLYICSASWVLACLVANVKWLRFKINFRESRIIFKRCWDEGKWLFGYRVLAYFRGNMVVFLLGFHSGVSSVGILRVLQTLYGPINVFLAGLDSFLPQVGTKIYASSGLSNLLKYCGKVGAALLAVWTLYTLGILLHWELLLEMFFSLSDPGLGILVAMQAAFSLVVIANVIIPIIVRIAGDVASLTLIPLLELSLYIVPGFILVREYSVAGALIWQFTAALSSAILMCVFFVIFIRRGYLKK